jgi:hypothetical protein
VEGIIISTPIVKAFKPLLSDDSAVAGYQAIDTISSVLLLMYFAFEIHAEYKVRENKAFLYSI